MMIKAIQPRNFEGTRKSSRVYMVLKTLIVSYLITAIVLLFLAFGLYKFDFSKALIHIGIILTYILANVIGGFMTGKIVKSNQWLWGMLMGLIYFMVLAIVSVCISNSFFGDLASTITTLMMCICGGMLGGMLS